MKKHQQKIEMVLDSKKIAFETIDISSDEDAKNRMRELSGDPKALPPQICNGDQYCGVSEKNIATGLQQQKQVYSLTNF